MSNFVDKTIPCVCASLDIARMITTEHTHTCILDINTPKHEHTQYIHKQKHTHSNMYKNTFTKYMVYYFKQVTTTEPAYERVG